jgi:hypothetical protein
VLSGFEDDADDWTSKLGNSKPLSRLAGAVARIPSSRVAVARKIRARSSCQPFTPEATVEVMALRRRPGNRPRRLR